MAIGAISTSENKKSNYLLAGGIGAVAGAAARYVVPTKTETSQIFNKEAFKKFASGAAAHARSEQRSILKYAGLGALFALGINAIRKACAKKQNMQEILQIEYSKYGALLDAPDYACEIMWLA